MYYRIIDRNYYIISCLNHQAQELKYQTLLLVLKLLLKMEFLLKIT
nr:MAG TPA: hypothetical protein [Caudoviricetes sp.]